MKKIFLSLFIFILSNFSCSLKNVSGTETGNPDISVVLSSALSIFDTLQQWNPSYYLPEGENQLDPTRLSTIYHSYIAKKKVIYSSDSLDTQIIHLKLIDNDKIVIIDTIFTYDTIISRKEIEDTATKNIGDSLIYFVNRKSVTDTSFLKNTVITSDTILIIKDTINDFLILTNNIGEKIAELKGDLTSTELLSYAINYKTNLVSDTEESLSNKQNIIEGAYSSDSNDVISIYKVENKKFSLTESYMDYDGDNFIFSALNDNISKVTYNLYYLEENKQKKLRVDFDAGVDNKFSTTNNNRIINLFYSYTDVNYLEEVNYGHFYFGYHGDTLFLNRKIKKDRLEDLTLYKILRGNDTLNHRENRLISCVKNVTPLSDSIKKYDLTIVLESSLLIGQKPSTASLISNIDFGEGNIGIIDATIDYTNNSITGKYLYLGKEYTLKYYKSEASN